MQTETLYMNAEGSKWIVVSGVDRLGRYDRSPMDFILIKADGTSQKRRADYYEQFGNFATVSFRIKGIRYSGFFENFEKIDDLPILRRYSRVHSKREIELLESYENAIDSGRDLSDTQVQNYYDLIDNHIIDTRR